MGLTRKLNWDTRAFHDFLLERATVPFGWGGNDCALFAADAVEAITGVDIAADFRGKYTNEAGAFAAIREVTGGATVGDAAAWCAVRSGMVELEHPLMAQRGDLVLIENGSETHGAGIVHLNGRHVVAVSEAGLFRLPITAVKRAWHY